MCDLLWGCSLGVREFPDSRAYPMLRLILQLQLDHRYDNIRLDYR